MRRIALILAVVSLCAAQCGCARRSGESGGRVVIEWYAPATPEFLKLYREEFIPEFERLHPRIKVRLNASLGDTGYDAKLLTLIAGGIPPDVVHFTQVDYPYFAAKGLLLDVGALARPDKSFSLTDYFGPVLDGMRVQKRLYGLPSDFSTIVLFYNRELFDRANVSYPASSWTWDDFVKAARRLTIDKDKDGNPEQFGFVNQASYNRWPAWVWANGGEILDRSGKKCLMDQPAAVQAMRFYTGLSTHLHVAPAAGQGTGQSADDLFASGRVAMICNSRYAYKSMFNMIPFKWDVAHPPRQKRRATTLIWGCNSILRTTKHPKQCWEFLKFLSGREAALANIRSGNAIPAYKPIALAPGALKAQGASRSLPEHDRVFLEAIDYARTAPTPVQFADYTEALTILDDAFLGLRPVDEVCRDFARRTDQALKEKP